MTHSHAEIRALLQMNGLSPSRALGQNFVGDANTQTPEFKSFIVNIERA